MAIFDPDDYTANWHRAAARRQIDHRGAAERHAVRLRRLEVDQAALGANVKPLVAEYEGTVVNVGRDHWPDIACMRSIVLFICVFMPRWTRDDVPTGSGSKRPLEGGAAA
jgi:hypothetical protein